MFQLRLTPDFSRQRQALLSETSTPAMTLPPSLERTLSSFGDSESIRNRGIVWLWLEALRTVRPFVIKGALLALFSSACAASSTLAAMEILKQGQSLRAMWLFAAVYFAMNVTAKITIMYTGRLSNWVGLGAESHLVGLISGKLLRLSALAASRQSSGNLKTLVTSDVRNIGTFLENATRSLVPALAAVIVIAPLLVRFAGRAGFWGLIVMAALLPITLVLYQFMIAYQTRGQGELDHLTSLSGEWVKNIRLIRYLSWGDAFQNDIAGGLRRFMSISAAQHLLACLIWGLSMSWWMVSVTGVVLLSRWLNSPVDLIGFFGALWLLSFLNGYFTSLPQVIRQYGLAVPSVRRIVRLLNEEEQSDHLQTGIALETGATPVTIILENVRFQYPDGREVLSGLSLRLPLRSRIAIIGEIGAGKTTLLKLLCGELPPTEGRVMVEFDNGQILDLWTRSVYPAFRSHLAKVPQEPFVSSDLLHRNISLSEDSTGEDVLNAAYWAELEEDLAALPDGLAQEIGESGVNLSGGQRQRLNLARAFYSGRGYMVLDDTLSAVDTKTEISLMERLVASGRGFALVTHRTGELMRVEEVIVMKEGAIVERGAPAALAADAQSHFTRVLRAYETAAAHG